MTVVSTPEQTRAFNVLWDYYSSQPQNFAIIDVTVWEVDGHKTYAIILNEGGGQELLFLLPRPEQRIVRDFGIVYQEGATKTDFKPLDLPRANRYREALDVQDACNLGGVSQAFARVVQEVSAEVYANNGSTSDVWRDPAVVLFASKIASLTNCEAWDTLAKAHAVCHERSER